MLRCYFLRFFAFVVISQLSSCAKMGYLWDQGRGQVSLFWRGRSNQDVLNDPKVSELFKHKIKLIEKYKAYFYKYWQREAEAIYCETTILDQDAVTYLVIASPYDQIKPLTHDFPFMGSFPYLGFFSHEKASKYAQSLEEKNWVTYIRPVYAYSTLGYFEDNILSSFFEFDDFSLAELVFHELFHTIFFIKNEVALNESLATFFSRKMVYEYLGLSNTEVDKRIEQSRLKDHLMRKMVKHIGLLNEIYKKEKPRSREDADNILKKYLSSYFFKDFTKYCKSEGIKDCFPVEKKWSNASLAALMTYQNKEKKLDKLFNQKSMSLKEFFNYIDQSYENFLNSEQESAFSDGLFH